MSTATAVGIAPATDRPSRNAEALADRVCEWFRRPGNQDEELALADIAQRYGLTMPVARTQLEAALEDQRLVYVQGDTGKVYRAGPKLGPSAAQAAAPAPIPHLAAAKNTAKGKAKPRLPPLDLSSIKVKTDVPIPPDSRKKGFSQWNPLIDQLDKPGKSIEVPLLYRGSITKTLGDRTKQKGWKFQTRVLPGDLFGIWRTE